jgi:hypothetical protein
LDNAEKYGSQFCEDGKDTFAKFGSVAMAAGSMIKKTPILPGVISGATRNTLGRIGNRIAHSRGVTNLTEQNGFAGFVGDKLYNMGRNAMEVQVGGVSYREDQNTRMERMRDLENSMGDESRRRRQINRLGIAGGDGNIDLNRVENERISVDPSEFTGRRRTQ